jgi:hypothetical protein
MIPFLRNEDAESIRFGAAILAALFGNPIKQKAAEIRLFQSILEA